MPSIDAVNSGSNIELTNQDTNTQQAAQTEEQDTSIFENHDAEYSYDNTKPDELTAEEVLSKYEDVTYSALDEDSQKSYLEDSEISLDGYEYQKSADGPSDYYVKTDEETGVTDYIKVVRAGDDESTTKIVHTTIEDGADRSHTKIYDQEQLKDEIKADKFDDWSESEDNYNKVLNGEEVEDLKMFNLNSQPYSENLKDYSQGYLDKYDTDNDGKWSKAEFTNMFLKSFTDEQTLPFKQIPQFEALRDELFDDLNMSQDDYVDSEEFAAQLFVSDIDWANYNGTNLDEVVDGKLNYINYNTLPELEKDSTGYQFVLNHKQALLDLYNSKKII